MNLLIQITSYVLIILIFICCSSPDDINNPISTDQELPSFIITISAGQGGIVNTAGGIYTEGTLISVTATPNNGYRFLNWSDGSTEPSRSIEITSNVTIIANFELEGLQYISNSFVIQNPNERKIDLVAMLNANPGIFVYQKDGFKYLIVPGVSDLQRDDRSSSPRGKTFVFYKDSSGWSNYTVETDNASTWVVRNFDQNQDFFVLGDANEIGDDWQNWKGDIIKGTPTDGSIQWERINTINQMGFYHDVSIGNLNSDNIPDILGVGFKVFLGNMTGGYDFIGGQDVYGGDDTFIDYRFNKPLAFELYDLDNDGLDEIISADYNEQYGTLESNRITVHKYSTEEQKYEEVFSSVSPTEFFNEDLGATSIQVVDLNNDNLVDVLVARESQSGESFESWINDGDLTFSPQFSKKFECNYFNFLEFEVMDVNGDGNIDVVLRPELCGGVPTSSFLFSSYPEDGNGIRINDCIWINDGLGNFTVYESEELTSPLWVDYLYPYIEENILHFVGFEFDGTRYDEQNGTMPLNVIDFEIDLR